MPFPIIDGPQGTFRSLLGSVLNIGTGMNILETKHLPLPFYQFRICAWMEQRARMAEGVGVAEWADGSWKCMPVMHGMRGSNQGVCQAMPSVNEWPRLSCRSSSLSGRVEGGCIRVDQAADAPPH